MVNLVIISENNMTYEYHTKETRTKNRGTQVNMSECLASPASNVTPNTSTHAPKSATKAALHTPIKMKAKKSLQVVHNLPGRKAFKKTLT